MEAGKKVHFTIINKTLIHHKFIVGYVHLFASSSHVINVFRRQGCPHLGQGHVPIVLSASSLYIDILQTTYYKTE